MNTSVPIAAGNRRVNVTMTMWNTFGRMCRKMIRTWPSPSARAAMHVRPRLVLDHLAADQAAQPDPRRQPDPQVDAQQAPAPRPWRWPG